MSGTLLENGATRLAVAIIDEAVQLRQNNIDVPLLILGHTPERHLEDVIRYDLTQTVFTYGMAEALSKKAADCGKRVKIHIKIDTGMGRIGFFPDRDAIEALKSIQSLPNIEIEAMFTHFPSADEEDKSFTYQQIRTFSHFKEMLAGEGVNIPKMHAANSACIIDIEEGYFDFVRPGLILYGLYPSDAVQKSRLPVKPAMALKSRVAFVKDMEPGMPVSYGRTFTTRRKSRIATIPVGYADGYSRVLSSRGKVIIRGMYAPVAGRVCMDQFMADVTDIPGVKTGDEAILMGSDGNLSVPAEEIAAILGTINYEVVCRVGKRVPRVYIKNGKPLK